MHLDFHVNITCEDFQSQDLCSLHTGTPCSYQCPTERLPLSLSHLGTARAREEGEIPLQHYEKEVPSAAQPESRSLPSSGAPTDHKKDTLILDVPRECCH